MSAAPVPPAAFWKPWQRYYVVHKVSRSTVSQPAARKLIAVREAISCGPGIKCKIAHSTAREVALWIYEVSTIHWEEQNVLFRLRERAHTLQASLRSAQVSVV